MASHALVRHPYYLALGDSLATGVQPIGSEAEQFRTNEGYPDRLHERAKKALPGLRLVKLGYPGESTTTMIEGGLYAYPRGNQLDEAVAFLEAHGSSVAFVTIDIGFNDFPCHEFECLAPGMELIARNLPHIVGRLRAVAPKTPIVGMTIYDPFLRYWLTGPEGRELAKVSVWEAVLPINALLREIYGGAGCLVADVEGAFSTTDFETTVPLPGFGPAPLNVARIADWTWAVSPPPLGPDNHANGRGYAAIAGAFEDALRPHLS